MIHKSDGRFVEPVSIYHNSISKTRVIHMNKSQTQKAETKSQEFAGEQIYKIYLKILEQLLAEEKATIDKYTPHPQSAKDRPKSLIQTVNQFLYPTFMKNIHKIINFQAILSKEECQEIIDELVKMIKIQLENIYKSLIEVQHYCYQIIVAQNQKILKQTKRMKKFQQFIWSGKKMYQLDILSLFLRLNFKYKKSYETCWTVISPKLICRIFEISYTEFDEYVFRYESYEPLVICPYQKDFEEIVLLFCLAELKIKITSFRRRYGRVKTEKIKPLVEKQVIFHQKDDAQLDEKAHFYSRAEYKYNFCEIAFIPAGRAVNKNIEMLKQLYKIQLGQKIKQALQTIEFFYRKRELLKLKVKFSISFLQMFMLYQDIKYRPESKGKNAAAHSQLPTSLQTCKWAFIKNASLVSVVQNILRIQLQYWKLYQNNNPLIVNLCQLAMQRLSLVATVLKAHESIQLKLYRKSIHICKFQYCLSDFRHQQAEKQENDPKFTLVVATAQSELMFVAIFQRAITDWEFGEIIKKTYSHMEFKKTYIIVYQFNLFDYTKKYHIEEVKNLFQIRNYGDVRVYITNSPLSFHIHFMIYFLTQSIIKRGNISKKTFLKIAQSSASNVVRALNASSQARFILFSLHRQQQQQLNRFGFEGFHLHFNEKQMRIQVESAHKLLCQGLINMNQVQSLWQSSDILHKGRVKYFGEQQSAIKQPLDLSLLQITDNLALNEQLISDEKVFEDNFIKEMKWRHQYLANHQILSIGVDLHHFMRQRQLVMNDIKRIFKEVVRLLYCYQVYLNQIMNLKEAENMRQLWKEVEFLRKVYSEQNRQIDKLYPNQKQQILKMYFGIDLKGQIKNEQIWKIQMKQEQTTKKIEELI